MAMMVKTEHGQVEMYDEDESYFMVDVFFLVEDRLFKVPRHPFEEGSEIFRHMFLSVPGNATPDGSIKYKPLRLDGINKEEFKQLLRAMYPRTLGQEESLTASEWTSVLKLSTMWQFGELRRLAIRKMSQLTMDTVEAIFIAREYQVTEWLLPCLHSLAQRKEPLGLRDVNRLGLDYVLKMAEVRESFAVCPFQAHARCSYCHNTLGGYNGHHTRQEHHFWDVIKRVFALDLEGLQ